MLPLKTTTSLTPNFNQSRHRRERAVADDWSILREAGRRTDHCDVIRKLHDGQDEDRQFGAVQGFQYELPARYFFCCTIIKL